MNTTSRLILSRAPTRICDLGGWTDTWFAGHGRVLNLAVAPYVHATVRTDPGAPPGVRLQLANYNLEYALPPRAELAARRWGPHPLLEAAVVLADPPAELALEIGIDSQAPPGAGMGTSAAVTVALLAALAHLKAEAPTPYELATAAQRVETELLGGQCGVQDQLCAAYGGINWIEMPAYPQAQVRQLDLGAGTRAALADQLAVVYLGQAHNSSQVHEMVIRSLEAAGAQHPPLEALRRAADAGHAALAAGDLRALGAAMRANTAAQESLHPELLKPTSRRAIALAARFGAWGWKVNGAGGPGGSLTVLLPPSDLPRRQAFLTAIERALPPACGLPLDLAHQGVQVWEMDASARED